MMKCSEEDETPDVFREDSGYPASADASVTFKMDDEVNCLISKDTSKYHQSFVLFGSVIQPRLSRRVNWPPTTLEWECCDPCMLESLCK